MTDHVLTPNQILPIFEKHHVNIAIKSDDGISYNLMHYMCYFGLIDGVKMLAESPESQAFLNDPTEESDIALTITLLSPETTVDVKETIAAYLYKSSNIAICNKASQNPIQLVLLMGKIDLLLHMLNFNPTVRYDSFGNSYLHLAIKAGLPTVARFILHYTNVGDINKKDCKGDTVLTLAIKSGDEELACEILQYDKAVDLSITGVDWNLPNCEKDLVIHQTLKRNMPQLANAVWRQRRLLPDARHAGKPAHPTWPLRYQLNSCIDFMLSRDVSSFINAPNDSDLDTPLLLSIKLGYYEQSLRILNCGGDVNFANRLGLTATHVIVKAAMGDYAQMAQETMNHDQLLYLMQEILNHRPNVMALCKNTDDCHSETSLHMAIRGGTQTEDLALILLAYCRDLVTIRDYDGCTPLIRAVESRSLRLVKALCVNQSELHVVNAAHDSSAPHRGGQSGHRDHPVSGEPRSVSAYLERGGLLSHPRRHPQQGSRGAEDALSQRGGREPDHARRTDLLPSRVHGRFVRVCGLPSGSGSGSIPFGQERALLSGDCYRCRSVEAGLTRLLRDFLPGLRNQRYSESRVLQPLSHGRYQRDVSAGLYQQGRRVGSLPLRGRDRRSS